MFRYSHTLSQVTHKASISMVYLLLFALSSQAFAAGVPPIASNSASKPVSVPSATSSLKVETGSQRVPAGTLLNIVFQTALDSKTSQVGDPFVAYLAKDFVMAGETPGTQRIVLPMGTVIRGRVNSISRPGYFSRGGSMTLAFDHAMLPSGDLMPLNFNLSTDNDHVNKTGAIYDDPGVGQKVHSGLQRGKTVMTDMTDKGYQRGKNFAGGLGTIVTVPVAAVGGALAGAGVTTGRTAVALVGRGESAIIKPGDTMTIDFKGSVTLPSE
jgi:hypothetical protein